MSDSRLKFYADRDLVSSLPEELVTSLRRQGIVRSGEERIFFCGFALFSKGIAVFLPRNSEVSNSEKPEKTATNLVLAMNLYFRERGTQLCPSDQGSEAYGERRLGLMLKILKDYSINGLFSRRVLEHRMNNGKVDWKRTIGKIIAVSTEKGPLYADFYGVRRRLDTECQISRIHAAVIRELDGLLGWAVAGGLQSASREALQDSKPPSGDSSYQIGCLEKAIDDVYSDRDIFVISSLIAYLRSVSGEELTSEAIGIRQFHGMWEHMLHECLSFTIRINQKFATPAYRMQGKYHAVARKGQRTDSVLKDPENDVFAIIDAKYYGANGLESVPGWPDLVKQFYYEKALKQLHPDAVIRNAFIFPGVSGVMESAHMARRASTEIAEEDLLDDEYGAIRCLYADPLEILKLFVSGRKSRALSADLLRGGSDDAGRQGTEGIAGSADC